MVWSPGFLPACQGFLAESHDVDYLWSWPSIVEHCSVVGWSARERKMQIKSVILSLNFLNGNAFLNLTYSLSDR